MRIRKIIYYFTVVLSMLVGLWHFFVPVMFQWYDYLPMQYENLIVGSREEYEALMASKYDDR